MYVGTQYRRSLRRTDYRKQLMICYDDEVTHRAIHGYRPRHGVKSPAYRRAQRLALEPLKRDRRPYSAMSIQNWARKIL